MKSSNMFLLVFGLALFLLPTSALPKKPTYVTTARYNDFGWELIPHEWGVYLHENHTLEKHFAFLGRELPIFGYCELANRYIINFKDMGPPHIESEDALLASICEDPGVHRIMQSCFTQIQLGIVHDDIGNGPNTPRIGSTAHQEDFQHAHEMPQKISEG